MVKFRYNFYEKKFLVELSAEIFSALELIYHRCEDFC